MAAKQPKSYNFAQFNKKRVLTNAAVSNKRLYRTWSSVINRL